MAKAMLISVGSSLSPIIHTLNKTAPPYIIFFASPETRNFITSILKSLEFEPRGIDQIISSSAEVLGECYRSLRIELPEKLRTWDIQPSELLVDYTGGTKTMSAAVVLATIEMGCSYSYVGGTERDKGGIGVVLDGKERMWYVNNPWDEIAVGERRKANILFNRARYTAALEVMKDICRKVGEHERPYYQAWVQVIEGYEQWDMFNHRRARSALEKGFHSLRPVAAHMGQLREKVRQLEDNARFLRDLVEGPGKEKLVYDLVANAMRRADLESKYDDAVARLYRAMELAAQARLAEAWGIDTSHVRLSDIPPSLATEYEIKYSDADGKIRLPLYASYRLLKEKGDDLGIRFIGQYDKILRPLLDQRNRSILAHGNDPIASETYHKLKPAVLSFLSLEEHMLPKFPVLEL